MHQLAWTKVRCGSKSTYYIVESSMSRAVNAEIIFPHGGGFIQLSLECGLHPPCKLGAESSIRSVRSQYGAGGLNLDVS